MYKITEVDIKNNRIVVEDLSSLFPVSCTCTREDILKADELGFRILGLMPNKQIVVFDNYAKLCDVSGKLVIYDDDSLKQASKAISEGSLMNGNSIICVYGSLYGLFESSNYREVCLSGLYVDRVTDMSSMFADATIYNLDITGWNTKCLNKINFMFSGFQGKAKGIGGMRVSNVESMRGTFSNMDLDLDLSGWDTSSCTDFSLMFEKYNKQKYSKDRELKGVGDFNVSCAADMFGMFRHSILEHMDLKNWVMAENCDVSQMFYECAIHELIMPDKSFKGSKMTYMFGGAEMDYLNISGWSMEDCSVMYLFALSRVKFLDMRNLHLSGDINDFGSMFMGARIETLDLSGSVLDNFRIGSWDSVGGFVNTLVIDRKDADFIEVLKKQGHLRISKIGWR